MDPASPGEEVVSGSASDDLQGFTGAGTDIAGWPKLTGDWTVANPLLGSFGTLDTSAGAKRVVIAMTRAGQVFGYATAASACASASWPRFHHDNANSGDARRDAVSPGAPTEASVTGGALSFVSPGDDLLCGRRKTYEVRTSDQRITPATFAAATPVPGTFTPVDAGQRARLDLGGAALRRFVAVRAVDDAGNVGWPAVV